MNLTIKKTFVVLTTMCILAAVPQESYGQNWLKKISQGIDKGFEAVDKGLNNVSKALGGSSSKSSQTNTATSAGSETSSAGNANNTTTGKSTTTVQQGASQQTFILQNGTLGPVKRGMAIGSLPKQYPGLYDKFTRDKEYYNDEDFDEYLLFTKNGQEIFSAYLNENKIGSICLLSGSSSFIKTPEGYYVGYSVNQLNKEKKLEWEHHMDEAETWATSGEYTYYVENNDVIEDDKNELLVRGFKTGAKIIEIAH